MYTQTDFVNALAGIGVKPGDRLIVHSSYKSLGKVDGGIKAVIRGLIEAVSPGGTIMMPVFNSPQDVWRADATPSRVGAITDVFRYQRDVVRSIHPTHSVAVWGDRAAAFIDGHLEAGALSVGSPMHKIAQAGGKVLGIGVDFRTCSLIHVSESIAKLPYLSYGYSGYDQKMKILLEDGSEIIFEEEEKPGDSKSFNKVMDLMREREQILEKTILDAPSYLADGDMILDASLELIKRDPAVMLCDKESCSVCVTRRKLIEEAGAS